MILTRNSCRVFSIGLCILIVFQISEAQNDVKEEIIELLNEIKNEEHKSLQKLREDLLRQQPNSNTFLGTNPNPQLRKRQNAQHILWSKLGKIRTGSDSMSSLRDIGKRTSWGTQPEQFENTFFHYPNEESSNMDTTFKTAKRANSQQKLWAILGDAIQGSDHSSLATTGKRTAMFKRPNAQHMIWAGVGNVLNQNSRLSSLATTGKRTALAGQPSKQEDEADYIEEILRQQETNDF